MMKEFMRNMKEIRQNRKQLRDLRRANESPKEEKEELTKEIKFTEIRIHRLEKHVQGTMS